MGNREKPNQSPIPEVGQDFLFTLHIAEWRGGGGGG